jgi:methylase of polypeptide subunit release factors
MQHAHDLMSATALSMLISYLHDARYEFVTPTPATHYRVNRRPGNQEAYDLAGAFGWSRPFSRCLLSDDLFHALRDGGVLVESANGWNSRVRASTLGRDIFLHSAFPTTASDAVFFGPDTYRFARAIRSHLTAHPRHLDRVLDLGCGSGAGGVVVAKGSSCTELLLTDINDAALRLARVNADTAGLVKARTVHSDLFSSIEGRFDLIVANPPYLNDPLERAYRHGGGELGSGLSLRIVQAAAESLSPGGVLLLYTGSPMIRGVDQLLHDIEQSFAGGDLSWSYEEIDPDVFGEELDTDFYSEVDRIAAVVLTARSRK